MRTSTIFAVAVVAALASVSCSVERSVQPCPDGCRCFAPSLSEREQCTLEMRCVAERSLPDLISPAPQSDTDCVLLSATRPIELASASKMRLLNNLPSGIRSLNLEFASMGSSDGLPPRVSEHPFSCSVFQSLCPSRFPPSAFPHYRVNIVGSRSGFS